jgi:hypothetical protein
MNLKRRVSHPTKYPLTILGRICREGQTRVPHAYIIADIDCPCEKVAMDIKRSRGEDDCAMRRALTAQEADQLLVMAKDTDANTSDSNDNVSRPSGTMRKIKYSDGAIFTHKLRLLHL